MHLFFAPGLIGNQFPLKEDESLHLSRVLRLKLGETVQLLDGVGGLFEGEIQLVHQKNSVIGNIRKIESRVKRNYQLHIAIAPTKMMERLEWFLEKATEIGIDQITPIITQHSERTIVKQNRLEKIVQAAMKQSKQTFLPIVNESVSFEQFIQATHSGKLCIAHCIENKKTPFKQIAATHNDICILIGPEGDFSQQEVDKAIASNYLPISLGNSRLRTETAGVVAAVQMNLIHDL
jgi:16S rRNA (uracil1498-N3)-methyltransferase